MAKEYIEREAMIQRFKNTPLFSNFNTGGIFLRDGVIDLVEKQFAADVVEVVRCKDCKHYSYEQSIHRYECNIFNGAYGFIGYPTKPNDFCSYGERKE